MAIQTKFNSNLIGTTLPEAYIKLENFNVVDNMVNYTLSVYLNEEARRNGAKPLDYITGSLPLEAVESAEGTTWKRKVYTVAKSANKMLRLLRDSSTDV